MYASEEEGFVFASISCCTIASLLHSLLLSLFLYSSLVSLLLLDVSCEALRSTICLSFHISLLIRASFSLCFCVEIHSSLKTKCFQFADKYLCHLFFRHVNSSSSFCSDACWNVGQHSFIGARQAGCLVCIQLDEDIQLWCRPSGAFFKELSIIFSFSYWLLLRTLSQEQETEIRARTLVEILRQVCLEIEVWIIRLIHRSCCSLAFMVTEPSSRHHCNLRRNRAWRWFGTCTCVWFASCCLVPSSDSLLFPYLLSCLSSWTHREKCWASGFQSFRRGWFLICSTPCLFSHFISLIYSFLWFHTQRPPQKVCCRSRTCCHFALSVLSVSDQIHRGSQQLDAMEARAIAA